MKIIAFYLPQFHVIPENEKWWGKGFTDWDNVRKATPIFDGHVQPRIPLDSKYYDLSDPQNIKWQAQLAQKYHVHGFCFYHYWFNGKLLLEKPAELLLQNKDIDIHFCFSWANEPWARTWDGKAHHVLMPQEYGDKRDWKQHFEYLLPFFHDERYIKEDNCPMFLIYKSSSIKRAAEMMTCWNEWAKEAGLNGIHFVETLRNKEVEKRKLPFKAKVEFEPMRTLSQQPFFILNYKRVRRKVIYYFNKIFHSEIPLNVPFQFSYVKRRSLSLNSPLGTYGGVFIGWDNTPRRGLSSTIVLPPSKEEFKNYLKEKLKITSDAYHTNYVFVNAWNEWAEGTMLEPDKYMKYAYLEAIKELCTSEMKL